MSTTQKYSLKAQQETFQISFTNLAQAHELKIKYCTFLHQLFMQ